MSGQPTGADWLDDPSGTAEPDRQASPADIADQLFLDALLRETLEVDAASPGSRVESALARIAPHRPRRTRYLLLAAAAVLLVAIPILSIPLWFPTRSDPAPPADTELLAIAERVVHAHREERDLTYRMEVTGPLTSRPRVHRLFTRGPTRLVIRFSLPGQGRLTIGRDGDLSWLVPPRPNRPVLTAHGIDAFASIIQGQELDLLALDAQDAITRLRDEYTLTREPARHSDGFRFRAVARERSAQRPEELLLEVDPQRGRINRMTARWPRPLGIVRGREIVLSLESTAPLAADWFAHAPHHAPGRAVHEIGKPR